MINVAELRINNLVWNIEGCCPSFVKRIESRSAELNIKVGPIELTETWLISLGLDGIDDCYVINLDENCHLEIYKSIGGWVPVLAQTEEEGEPLQAIKLKEIQFVHQLQNLIYSLKGIELTLDPEKDG